MLKLSKAIAQWQPSETDVGQPPIALLEAGWEEIVGCEVAQNSHPARVADGTLTVTTRSSAWSHQLSFLAEHLLRAVAARLPDAGIESLRFRVGRVLPRRRSRRESARLCGVAVPGRSPGFGLPRRGSGALSAGRRATP